MKKTGKRRLNGIEWAKQDLEIRFYAESLFFQVKSFLDVFIKFLVNKNYSLQYNQKKRVYKKKEIYFNNYFLKKIKPRTVYINNLMIYWESGINKKKYSLRVFNAYRNLICHEFPLSWAHGHLSSNKFRWYLLPNSLRSKKPSYRKNTNLFELCDEIYMILDRILRDFDKQTKYQLQK